MVLRFPFLRPQSCARLSLFWEENWKVPEEDWTHQMQLLMEGVWSISNRNWNRRSFLFPAKEELDTHQNWGDHCFCVHVIGKFVKLLTFTCMSYALKVRVKCIFAYLTVAQEVRSFCFFCPCCQKVVKGNPGNLDTGSYWIGNRSRCMQEPRMSTQYVPK